MSTSTAGEQVRDALETVLELGRFQELLFVRNLDVEEARDHVGDIDGDSIAWTLLASSAGACGSSDIASTAFCFRYSARASTSGWWRRCRAGTRPAPRGTGTAHLVEHPEATLALAHEVMRAVGGGEVTHDGGRRSHAMQVVEARLLGVGLLLQQEAHLGFGPHGFLGPGHRLLALDRDRHDHAREEHHVAHREDDQHVRRQRRCLARFGRRIGSGSGFFVGTHVRTFGELSAGSATTGDNRARSPARSSPRNRVAVRAAARRARRGSRAGGSLPVPAMREPTLRLHDQLLAVELDLQPLRRHARQRHLDQQFAVALVDIDRRFPSGLPCERQVESTGAATGRPPRGGAASAHIQWPVSRRFRRFRQARQILGVWGTGRSQHPSGGLGLGLSARLLFDVLKALCSNIGDWVENQE